MNPNLTHSLRLVLSVALLAWVAATASVAVTVLFALLLIRSELDGYVMRLWQTDLESFKLLIAAYVDANDRVVKKIVEIVNQLDMAEASPDPVDIGSSTYFVDVRQTPKHKH